ncbi:MAG TPA: hypothetical protein PK611_08210 [Saprospiraceae bacterium]|nr:hypothetical protein [Saprospiraceae bacterium]HRO07859.1 hypothetical protein [Saprospiraceae bacterium]HRO73637.1 hypothetical protein [Saprospiraceae bacterium]HRP41257.1 hypothetical protein [Saprospiraceae bacterium]
MTNRLLTLIIASFIYTSGIAQGYLSGNTFDFGKIVNPDLLKIPNPKDVVSLSMVASVLNVAEEKLSPRSSKGSANNNVKSTFYTIINGESTYNGMIFQISTNPVYIEAPTFISFTLDNRIEHGEYESSTNRKMEYKEGYAGKIRYVYSAELGRITWNIGDNYLLTLGFNGTLQTADEMTKAANLMVPDITKNFLAKLLE